jgi:hypothetical protein
MMCILPLLSLKLVCVHLRISHKTCSKYINIDVAKLQPGMDNNQQLRHAVDSELDAEPNSPASITIEGRLEYLRRLSNMPEFFQIFQYVEATPVSNSISYDSPNEMRLNRCSCGLAF